MKHSYMHLLNASQESSEKWQLKEAIRFGTKRNYMLNCSKIKTEKK